MSLPAYPSYKDSGAPWLGQVPAHWEVIALKRIVDPLRQITYGIVQAGPHVAGGIPYIRPTDMEDEAGVLDEAELQCTTAEIAKAYSRSEVQAGDLICSIGPSFGKVMLVPASLAGANLTQGTARIAVEHENEPRFVFWSLRAKPTVYQWESAIGGATFRALNLGPLAETLLALPPLAEQQAIAAWLDERTGGIDEAVAAQRTLLEQLKEKRRALIAHAVTRGLDPAAPLKDSGIEWLGMVPQHWEVKKLKYVFPTLESGVSVNSEGCPAEAGEIGVLKTSCVYGCRFTPEENKRVVEDELSHVACPVTADSLIISRMNTPDLVGASGYVDSDYNNLYLPDRLWIARFPAASELFGKYAWFLVNSEPLTQLTGMLSTGTSSTMRNLTQDAFLSIDAPLPPLAEQQAIAAFLDAETAKLDTLTAETEKTIALLQEHRTALIAEAVTGKIRVPGV